MSGDTTDWTELREFAAVDLLQSFVVSWIADGESLFVELDLNLLPEHPFYENPRPAEGACIRQAVIEFPYCRVVTESGNHRMQTLSDSVASLHCGQIAGLRRTGDGQYELCGDFGTIDILAERPLLHLKGI